MALSKSPNLVLASHLVNHSNLMLMAVDASTRSIVLANTQACRLLGYPDGLIGVKIEDIESNLAGMLYWQEVATGNIHEVENVQSEFRQFNGSYIPVEKTVSRCEIDKQQFILISASDITKRLHTEGELAQVAARLKSTLESTADGILVIDRDGVIEGMNHHFSRMWDIPEDTLCSGADQKVMDYLFHSVVDRDVLREFMHTFDVDEHAITVNLKNGNIFEIKSCPQQATSGRVFSCNDITIRVRAEKLLRKSLEKLQYLLDSMLEGVYGTDIDGCCTFVNPSFLRILGFQRAEQVLGKDMHALIHCLHTDEGLTLPSKDTKYQDCQICSIDHSDKQSFWRKDQIASIPVEYWSSTIVEDGKETGKITTFIDISERKKIEQMKSEFTSTVSHELRTPLTAISGALGLLKGGALGEFSAEIQRLIDIAYKNSRQLNFLINDLLDLEKLSAGKMRFNMQQFELMPLVEQAIDSNLTYGLNRNIKLSLVCTAPNSVVKVDSQRLQQVLNNLLSNAIKFSPADSAVEVSVLAVDNVVRVMVTDQGNGIPMEFRDRVFQKFSQADSSSTRQQEGTGLGLAITRELVERMGGQIGYISAVGNGTCFYFDLPLVQGNN